MKNKKLGKIINLLFDLGINKFHYDKYDLRIEGDLPKITMDIIKSAGYSIEKVEGQVTKVVNNPPYFVPTSAKRLPENIEEVWIKKPNFTKVGLDKG